MAWDDVLKSIFHAAWLLGKEITEQDLPGDWNEMRRLRDDLWAQVRAKELLCKASIRW